MLPLPSSPFALPLSAVALSLGAASCSQYAHPGHADPLAVEERSVGPGARSQLDLRGFGDDALEQQFLRSVERCRTNAAHEPQVQRCLTEMARRGGERWIEIVSGRMRALQAAHALDQPEVNEQSELVFLTARRRAQRAPEPAQPLLGPGAISSTMGAEGWSSVDLAEQFEALDPGEYSVVLSYSPAEEIAFLRETQGLIVVSSEPFPVRVEEG